jgi:hypothetical protein
MVVMKEFLLSLHHVCIFCVMMCLLQFSHTSYLASMSMPVDLLFHLSGTLMVEDCFLFLFNF